MIDPKLLRSDLESIAKQLKVKGFDLDCETFLTLEAERKALQLQAESLQQERNVYAKSMGKLMGEAKAKGEDVEPLKLKGEKLKNDSAAADVALADVQVQLDDLVQSIPNLPHKSVPAGSDENDNVEVRTWGTPKQFDFDVKDHVDLGAEFGGLDFDVAAKITGSRFSQMRGGLASLHRALTQFMLNTHIHEHGYEEVYVPYIVNRDSLYGTGQLPKFENDQFEIKFDEGSDRKFLIPTAEVILTNIVKDKIVDQKDLPMRFVASTPCFRKEAGSYGKDTKGMIRQHQFYKVEMVSIVEKENCLEELERMTNCATDILDKLELPYRKVILCSGDMGFSAEKTYDIEVWLPSENKYREISSCSSCSTFQAQRMKSRYKNKNKETVFVGTLNGSGLAVGRTLIAVLENYQQKDGSIIVPKILRPYMNNLELISAK